MSRKSKKFNDIMRSFKGQAKSIYKSSALLKSIIVACVVGFLELSSYYSLLLWLPEIFERFAQFESKFPNESTSICTVSNQLLSLNTSMVCTSKKFFNLIVNLILKHKDMYKT